MAPRQRRRTGWVSVVFLIVVGMISGVGIAIWRGAGPLPDPPGCAALVGGHKVELSPSQGSIATLIAAIGVRRELPARAVSIALATAYQESKISNLLYGDRDSLGIFQQRPSQGWGTRGQILDPYYSTNKFYDELERIEGYESMRITEAAQQVQRSAFPEAYEDHAEDGRALASAMTGYSSGGAFSCVVRGQDDPGVASDVTTAITRAYGRIGARRTGSRQDVEVPVRGDAGNRLGWSVAAFLVARADSLAIHEIEFDGRLWRAGRDSEDGWTRSTAEADRVLVRLG